MKASRAGAGRRWAWPFVPLYVTGLAAKDALRRAGVLPTRKLAWPVVSVGSLSAGGAGKTPVVIALAELLREHGWAVDVLSRGYGREERGVDRVDPDAADAALRFGDEPVVIARRAGVPVWVGTERFAAGVAAEAHAAARGEKADPSAALRDDKQEALRDDKQKALQDDKQTALRNDKQEALQDDNQTALRNDRQRRAHLLDDGFQHRGLARAADIVLVTERDLEGALLPAGNRREPLAALRRADVVVLREEERERIERRAGAWMREDAAVWTVRRTLEIPGAGDLRRRNCGVLAFCAIARPEDFVDTLRTGGMRVVDSIAFPDHHRYTAEDMQRLTEHLRTRAGNAFVTTEKDAVKLTPELRAQLEMAAPLVVARLQTTFLDPETVLRELEARLL